MYDRSHMTSRTTLLFAALAVALPLVASAQTNPHGIYVRVSAGINTMEQEDVHAGIGSAPNELPAGEELTAAGPALTGAFGWQLRHGLRVEVEGAYRANHITGETGLGDTASGSERKTGVMGNVVFDVHVARLTPYVGGGIGAQVVHEPEATTTSSGVVVAVSVQGNASLAYQAIAGVAVPIQRVPGLSVTAEYRYLGLAGTRTYTGTATIPGVGELPLTDVSSNNRNHSLLFGIRYVFHK